MYLYRVVHGLIVVIDVGSEVTVVVARGLGETALVVPSFSFRMNNLVLLLPRY